jgi:hypothetical protein
MKSSQKEIKISDVQVPFDSTWSIRDSVEISSEGDTLWVKRAEKHFPGVKEINLEYKSDSGTNRNTVRHTEFRKRFKWFNTEYSFSEIIGSNLHYGYPVSDFLTGEELKWFYSPDNTREERENSSDSLRFRALSDTVDEKTEKWMIRSLVSEWIGEFAGLLKEDAKGDLSVESLRKKELEFADIVKMSGDKFDSLWSNGVILRQFIGDSSSVRFRNEADSAANIAIDRLLIDFSDYTVRTVMPGKVTETNGFIDSAGVVFWPVSSDYFLTQQYEMKTVSKVANVWAWIVSGLFLVFVISGLYKKRRG